MKTMSTHSDAGTAQTQFLPYARQTITDEDVAAVIEVLRSDWLTQGPLIERFEKELSMVVSGRLVVSCSSGTAALHMAMGGLGLGPGDWVVTTPITFLASANCARYVGAEVMFADIDPDTANIDLNYVEDILRANGHKRIKAVVAVHYAGQPCDIAGLWEIAATTGVKVVEDACHALGASYLHLGTPYKVGCCMHSNLTVFSFHPVKHIATGEGGAVVTHDENLARRLRRLRSHGVTKEHFEDHDLAYDNHGQPNPWYYEMTELGFNYRLTDIQAALGLSQLKKLATSLARRNQIAKLYERLIAEAFDPEEIRPLKKRADVEHAYHLFVVRIDYKRLGITRATLMNRLRDLGIGTQVHYIPLHLQPYYRNRYHTKLGDFPNAEAFYQQALSLPMYPALRDSDVERVVDSLLVASNKKSHRIRQKVQHASSSE